MMAEVKSLRVRVHGRVQGVCFRAWTRAAARELGLSGWARNRADGTVEVNLTGPPGQVDQMLERLREGPPAARVTAVEIAPDSPFPGDFAIWPTK